MQNCFPFFFSTTIYRSPLESPQYEHYLLQSSIEPLGRIYKLILCFFLWVGYDLSHISMWVTSITKRQTNKTNVKREQNSSSTSKHVQCIHKEGKKNGSSHKQMRDFCMWAICEYISFAYALTATTLELM